MKKINKNKRIDKNNELHSKRMNLKFALLENNQIFS